VRGEKGGGSLRPVALLLAIVATGGAAVAKFAHLLNISIVLIAVTTGVGKTRTGQQPVAVQL
jgi:hypothetical protein